MLRRPPHAPRLPVAALALALAPTLPLANACIVATPAAAEPAPSALDDETAARAAAQERAAANLDAAARDSAETDRDALDAAVREAAGIDDLPRGPAMLDAGIDAAPGADLPAAPGDGTEGRLRARLEDLVARAQPAPGEPVRVVEVGRDAHASHHLVGLRGAETPHRHERHDLTVVMLRGHGRMRQGDETLPVGEGSILYVPRGRVHAFTNESSEPAVAYVIYHPPFDGRDAVPVEPAAAEATEVEAAREAEATPDAHPAREAEPAPEAEAAPDAE